jgi:hypothetical protein
MVSRGGGGGGKPAPSAININKPCKDIKTNGGGRWVSFSKAKHRTKNEGNFTYCTYQVFFLRVRVSSLILGKDFFYNWKSAKNLISTFRTCFDGY